MSPILHPWLSALYGITYLLYFGVLRKAKLRKMWALLAYAVLYQAQFVIWIVAFLTSPDKIPAWYWNTYWGISYLMHGVVAVMLIEYGMRCAKIEPRLPRSFRWSAFTSIPALICTVIVFRWNQIDPDPSRMLSVDQYTTLWLAGILIICYLCNSLVREFDTMHRVMQGFMVLYCVLLVTSTCRVCAPFMRETLWLIDLGAEFGVSLYWCFVVKSEKGGQTI